MNLQEKINNLLKDLHGVGEEEIIPETKLKDDLGFDSLDDVEVVMNIEKEFNIHISDDEAEGLKTVQDLYDITSKKVK